MRVFAFLCCVLVLVCAAKPLARVQAVRVGEHPTKTRFVLDMTARTSFSYDLDNTDRLLVVEIFGIEEWDASLQMRFPNSPRIKGYMVSKGSQGSMILSIDLKSPVRLGFAGFLHREKNILDRLVFDLEGL